jgi:hypothetical protein
MQRQLRLGDILDDYCPRERRVTNHVIVAMVGPDVKQTRCTTCDAEHEYKKAKVPRQRRKKETPAALYAAVQAGAPKRVAHEHEQIDAVAGRRLAASDETETAEPGAGRLQSHDGDGGAPVEAKPVDAADRPASANSDTVDLGDLRESEDPADPADDDGGRREEEDGPVHRPLIRASLPRLEGQAPPQRQAPEFTIRQPGGRPNRFRPRHQRGGQPFQGQSNRSNGMGGGPPGGGPPRHGSGGRPPHGAMPSRLVRRDGPGRKRSK